MLIILHLLVVLRTSFSAIKLTDGYHFRRLVCPSKASARSRRRNLSNLAIWLGPSFVICAPNRAIVAANDRRR